MAAALAIRPGSLTGTLDSMEAKGILQRQSVKGDARQQKLVLLPGAKELVDLLPQVDAAIVQSLGALGMDDISRLNEVMSETEGAIREKLAVPTPAPLANLAGTAKQMKSENDDREATPVKAKAVAPQPPKVTAPKAPTPVPAAAAPSEPWTAPPRRTPSEGSIGRGLFRIASRVISAADGRRRNKS